MTSELTQTKPTVEFSWDELEREQLKLKRKGNLTSLNSLDLGHTKEQIDLYEESFARLINNPIKDSIVDGTVISVNAKYAVVNIGCREDAYIDLSKEQASYLPYIVPGNKIQTKVLNSGEEKDFINLSYTQAVYKIKQDEIFNAIGKKVAYYGKIEKLVPGGYLVLLDEVETFMPGSLAGVNKLHDFEVMLGQTVPVMPVNFERGNIVVSHREYLHTLIPGKIDELKDDPKKKLTGFVTGSTPYGIFCEFNDCLTGMILATDLDEETKSKFEARQIKPGSILEFYVKEIISTKKIILTQIFKADPWDDIEERYKVPCTVSGKVTSIKEYGVFIEIEPGISGLLHSSEFENKEFKEGSVIDVKISRLDTATKKIYLSLK
jgi:small subunit ribosomal protein S1